MKRPKVAIAALAVAGVASIWALAPIDLVPRWAAIGTPTGTPSFWLERSQAFSDLPDVYKEVAPEGFMADLVGMRIKDARAEVEALPGNQTLEVTMTNFLSGNKDSAFVPTRLSAWVLFGRVIRVQANG